MGALSWAKRADHLLSAAYLRLVGERGGLLSFLFHGLFENEKEMDGTDMVPIQHVTVADFRRFVAYFAEHGYAFVGPGDILRGLDPGRKNVLLTFDDGYYNNLRALPVLREFNAPAIFFISANHVREGRCFWWDVLHRELKSRGWTYGAIDREADARKHLTHRELEDGLRREFGERCLEPRGDLDRPFTPAELAEFARDPLVHIGNHTADHAILVNYKPEGMREQIASAQESLRAITGRLPDTIAYPNGRYNTAVLEAARDCGLPLGFSTDRRKERKPYSAMDGLERLRIGRFWFGGRADFDFQTTSYRSDISLYGWAKARRDGSY